VRMWHLALLLLSAVVATADLGVIASSLGVKSLTSADYSCLAQNGYNTATFVTVNGGSPIPNVQAAVSAAKQAGFINFYAYALICPVSNPNVTVAINQVKKAVSGTGINFLWLHTEVTEEVNCWGSTYNNVVYLLDTVVAALEAGFGVGIYADVDGWKNITGNSNSFTDLPLFYIDADEYQNFTDFGAFGGWQYPAQKQFSYSGPTACPSLVDLVSSSWNPQSSTATTVTVTTTVTTTSTASTSTETSTTSTQTSTTCPSSTGGTGNSVSSGSGGDSASGGSGAGSGRNGRRGGSGSTTCPSSTAQTQSSTGQTQSSTGQTQSSTGQTQSSTGQTQTSTGQTDTSTGTARSTGAARSTGGSQTAANTNSATLVTGTNTFRPVHKPY